MTTCRRRDEEQGGEEEEEEEEGERRQKKSKIFGKIFYTLYFILLLLLFSFYHFYPSFFTLPCILFFAKSQKAVAFFNLDYPYYKKNTLSSSVKIFINKIRKNTQME